jgi:hypothetical protein
MPARACCQGSTGRYDGCRVCEEGGCSPRARRAWRPPAPPSSPGAPLPAASRPDQARHARGVASALVASTARGSFTGAARIQGRVARQNVRRALYVARQLCVPSTLVPAVLVSLRPAAVASRWHRQRQSCALPRPSTPPPHRAQRESTTRQRCQGHAQRPGKPGHKKRCTLMTGNQSTGGVNSVENLGAVQAH